MKIIITIDYSPWSLYSGGAQRSSHYIATTLSRRGHDVVVVNTKSPWEQVDVPSDLTYRHRWATFHGWRSQRKAFFRPLNAFSIARVVREELLRAGSDNVVVHANGEEGGLLYKLKSEFDFGFISTPRHPHYPQIMLKEKLRRHEQLFLRIFEGKYAMQQMAATTADFCVPPSSFAADLARTALKVDTDKIRVVHNGVPVEFLNYSYDADLGSRGPIVFFGRFTKVKGVDLLLEAYQKSGLKDRHDLHLIGRGELYDDLTAAISTHDLNENVKLIDWLNHDELGKVLSSCAFAVLPSLEENFSLAVLAATCVGAPVVSTSVGGTPEIIDHKTTGILVEPRSIDGLMDAMRFLADNRSQAELLGQAGSSRTRTHFTWEKAAESFENIYEASLEQYLGTDG